MSYTDESLSGMFELSISVGNDLATALQSATEDAEVAEALKGWNAAQKLPQTEESHATLTKAGNKLAHLCENDKLRSLLGEQLAQLEEAAEIWWISNPPPEEIEEM